MENNRKTAPELLNRIFGDAVCDAREASFVGYRRVKKCLCLFSKTFWYLKFAATKTFVYLIYGIYSTLQSERRRR